MYELPNMILAWVLFLFRPRRGGDDVTAEELDELRAENERLRTQLSNVAKTSR
jgi:hypothetical protein